MRIQHNIMAMNAYRNYNINTSAVSKNLEKLSSGYRINRAGDDAAGLAISEKMRAQITGLEAATKNVKDGISLVKTAEGAMQEVQDMLNRMVSLATQSANGTYADEVDRENLQLEVDQLRSEINRIADSSNFNGIKLLDGSLEEDKVSYTTKFAGATTFNVLSATGTDPAKNGTCTILHRDAKETTLTKFEINLDNVNFADTTASTGVATLSITDAANVNHSITFTLEAGKLYTSEDLAKAFAQSDSVSKGISLNGVTYNVSREENSNKLIFEMDETSAAAATQAASFLGIGNVSVTTTAATVKNGTNVANTVIQGGSPSSDVVLANTVQTTAWTDITDGKGIRIGNETYVFALTKDTLNTQYGAGVKVVDITDLATDKGKLDTSNNSNGGKNLEIALQRLTVAAKDNEMFSVGVGQDKKLSFQEKSTYKGDVDLSKEDVLRAQFEEYSRVSSKANVTKSKGHALTLQIGDTSDSFNQLKVAIGDIHTKALGIDGVSVATQAGAQAAVNTIKNAINQVSSIRGTLGATQNRLEHTQNNLSVMRENIQDAESTIRDTDIAEEMMSYTKNNILVQSAQAMLAQANQIPQGVLQLLG